VLDLAYDEARSLNRNHVGTEHLLLALICEEDGVAGRVLSSLGIYHEAALRVVADLSVEAVSNPQPRQMDRDAPAGEKVWSLVHARRQRMMADQLCLVFLYEYRGLAGSAVVACGGNVNHTAIVVEEEIMIQQTPKELAKGFLSASELLSLAVGEAESLGQSINPSHFLLAAVSHGQTAIATDLAEQGVTYEKMREWIAEHP
jgi:ATP-dependent Clp protease ATP-binding subunit ClpA